MPNPLYPNPDDDPDDDRFETYDPEVGPLRRAADGTLLTAEVIAELEREAERSGPEDWKPTTRRPGLSTLLGELPERG